FLFALISQAAPPSLNADSALGDAVTFGSRIAALHPEHVRLNRELAYAEDLWAEYRLEEGNWNRTLQLIRSAYLRRMQLARLHPADPDIRRDVAQSLGRLSYATASPDSSRRRARGWLEVFEQGWQRHPFSYHACLDLTFALRNAAYALQRCDSLAAALPLYRRLIDLRHTMAVSDTLDIRSYHQYANALDWASIAWAAAGAADSARSACERALAIRTMFIARAQQPYWAGDAYQQSMRMHARVEARLGEWAEARKAYDTLCGMDWQITALIGFRHWRDCIERAHVYRAHGDDLTADSIFAGSRAALEWAEARIR